MFPTLAIVDGLWLLTRIDEAEEEEEETGSSNSCNYRINPLAVALAIYL